MNASEIAYVEIYRRMIAKKTEITDAIAELRKVCASLENWQKTAGELTNALASRRPEWFDERASASAIRVLLIDYHKIAAEVNRQWQALRNEKRDIGFADPMGMAP